MARIRRGRTTETKSPAGANNRSEPLLPTPTSTTPPPPSPLARLALIHPGEGRAVAWSGAYFFCVLFAYYLLRPLRDEIGIRGDLDKLPRLWTVTTFVMLLCAPVFGFLVSRVPRRVFLPVTYRFFALCILGFFGAWKWLPESLHLNTGYVFYVWLSVFNLFAVSIFWGVMADVWTREQSKRLFAAIAIGGTLGAICGSAVPSWLVSGFRVGGEVAQGGVEIKVAPVYLLLASAGLLECAVWCVTAVRKGAEAAASPSDAVQRSREPGPGALQGLLLIARSPYLLAIALYMLLYTLTSTFLYFEQAAIVQAQITERDVRVAFFARIDFWVNVLTLVMQVFFTGRILTRIGLIGGLVMLPVLTAIGFACVEAWPTLTAFMIFSIARRGMHYGVDRPTREVLYTVLGPDEKYKSKSFIDTFVYRSGDLLGAWGYGPIAKGGLLLAGVAIGASALWGAVGALLARQNRHLGSPDQPRPTPG